MQPIVSDAALRSAFSVFEPYSSAALAVSGGPDSTALMALAHRWARTTGRGASFFSVLTVDHGLRPESIEEAAFVAVHAKEFGFTHATLTWTGEKPKAAVQAASRRARYGLIAAYCSDNGLDCLATGHTEDDQVETFLMRLARGSGLDGLAAIAPVSELGELPLIRPLLQFSKARLAAYLRSQSIAFVCDPSNSNRAFERIRMRLAAKELASAGISRKAISRSVARLGRSRRALSNAKEDFLVHHFHVTKLGQGEVSLDALRNVAGETCLRVLANILMLIGGKEEPPRMAKLEHLMEVLASGKRQTVLGGCLLISARKKLQVYREFGRLNGAPTACNPGSTLVWDGRFLVSFPEGIDEKISVAPLGEKGWALWRKTNEPERDLSTNRLAALTTPALWRAGKLLSPLALPFSSSVAGEAITPPVSSKLVPRLVYFLRAPGERGN
ncbi:MAG: tRNA lysidine(34) synthetase TilS [Rhodomicrobium sp.]